MGQLNEVWTAFPSNLSGLLARAAEQFPAALEEVRVRQGRPLMLLGGGQERVVTPNGTLSRDLPHAFLPSAEDLFRTVQLMSRNSLYAWEDEIRQGFLTLPGGHRAGLVGRTVLSEGRVVTLKQISGISLRLARAVHGAADRLLDELAASRRDRRVPNLLLFSPPQAGKTTVLRDLVRQLSSGVPRLGLAGVKVGLVDERSELAASYEGEPQLDVGPRTDVLDACPKAEGLMMLIRSMSPELVATDEVGRREDGVAIQEALGAGVTVIATAHGGSLAELERRPVLRELLEMGAFDAAALLGRSRGPGTLEGFWLLEGGRVDALAQGPGELDGARLQRRLRAADGG